MAGISITWVADSSNYNVTTDTPGGGTVDDYALWNSGSGAGTSVAPDQRKSGGGSRIGSISRTVSGNIVGFSGSLAQVTWSGGTPTGSGANNNACYNDTNGSGGTASGFGATTTISGIGTSTENIRVRNATFNGDIQLTVSLSDGSAGPTSNTSMSDPTGSTGVAGYYDIAISAGSAGQTATLTWTVSGGRVFSDIEPQAITIKAAASAVTGTAAWTEANDTASVAGAVRVAGTSSWTEANDTATIAGSLRVPGTSSWTEANDTAALVGAASVVGSVGWTEANDSAAIAGALTVSGSASWTESSDTAALSGTVGNVVAGSVSWTEANDTGSLAGVLAASGALAWVEASDSWTVNGLVTQPASGSIVWTEADDTATLTGFVPTQAVEPIWAGPYGKKRRGGTESYLERLLGRPLDEDEEEIEPETVEVIEKAVESAPARVTKTAAKQSLKAYGLALKEAYVEIYLELARQRREDEEVASAIAALL